jgi:hypothetical protein
MSTSALISLVDDHDMVRLTRVNWDGYPEGVGADLLNYFNKPEDVNELIDGGEIRTITGHDVEYYNEDDDYPQTLPLKEMVDKLVDGYLFNDYMVEFIYVMTNNGDWYVHEIGDIEGEILEDILD